MPFIEIDKQIINLEIINTNNKNWYLYYENKILYIKTPRKYKAEQINLVIENNKKRILRMISKAESRHIQTFDEGSKILFYGRQYTLLYATKNEVSINALYVKYSEPQEGYLYLAKKYGQEFYQQRINYYLNQFTTPLEVKQVALKQMKTRYGVCNIRLKKITFNTRLAYFPLILIDYIVVHELCHLLVSGHNDKFYQEVKKIMPNYKRLDKMLKEIK